MATHREKATLRAQMRERVGRTALLCVWVCPRIVVPERRIPSGTIRPANEPTPAVSIELEEFRDPSIPKHDNGDPQLLLTLGACGASTGLAPSNDATELGDAFGLSGTAGNGATAPLLQTSDSSSQTVESTMGGGGCAARFGDHSTTIAKGSASSDHWLSDQEIADARHDTSATQPISTRVTRLRPQQRSPCSAGSSSRVAI